MEYSAYRQEVEVKMARYMTLDDEVGKLKAEIEEYKLKVGRM